MLCLECRPEGLDVVSADDVGTIPCGEEFGGKGGGGTTTGDRNGEVSIAVRDSCKKRLPRDSDEDWQVEMVLQILNVL